MQRANSGIRKPLEDAKQAQALAPDWFMPVVYLAENTRITDDYDENLRWRVQQMDRARAMAPNETIRGWIEIRKQNLIHDRDIAEGFPKAGEIRRGFACVQAARSWMKDHWRELADGEFKREGYTPGGGGN